MKYILENVVVVCLSVILIFIAKGSHSYQVKTDKDAVDYLTHYGYVDAKTMPQGFTLKDCNKKLKEFQKLARVDVTGVLDSSTIKAMNSPRCGCPDFIHLSFNNDADLDQHKYDRNGSPHWNKHNHSHSHHHYHDDDEHESGNSRRGRRNKRYALSNRKWNKQIVTYSIVKYPTRNDLKISSREIENAVHQAFKIWEQHIDLKFRYQPNEIDVDIELSFEPTFHGDNFNFDGVGKTLAHAFFPGSGLGGNVHFEEQEDWRINSHAGVDLLYVTVHELGHSLGLGHSSDYGAIMYPMYRGYIPNLQLHSDDIRGIQEIYGRSGSGFTPAPNTTPRTTTTLRTTTTRRTTTTLRTTTPPRRTTTYKPVVNVTTTRPTHPNPGSDNNQLCDDPNIDAITAMFDDTILVFQGNLVYEIGKNWEGVLPGWPQNIASYFRGLEGNLNCVLTRSNGKTYFFKKGKYWRFTGKRMDKGYPRSISEFFPGIPDNLDACFEWDEEFVFVKDLKFWRFNTRKRPQVDEFFPMPISHWGLQERINAAFTAPDKRVYFFQDLYFWEFNKSSHTVTQSNQRTTIVSERWFGCWEP